jgi:hypothetical protein
MRQTAIAVSLLFLASASSSALAAGWMKAGLWEMSTKTDAMRQMPKLTPEQEAQMKKMGVTMPAMKDGAMVTKVCISKEMAERDHPPTGQNQSGCESKNFQRSGSSYSVDVVCDNANMKGTGSVKGTMSGDTFTSTYDFKGTARGQPINSHHESSGKYLGADCGDIKPMADMAKK